MKRLTRELLEEHQLIRRAAACLDRLADDGMQQEDLRVVTALDLLEFFEEFADTAHQEKEERFLFPALLEIGAERQRIHELLADHELDRRALDSMREHLEGTTYGDRLSRDAFLHVALGYAEHQREHIEEEDATLLPLIERLVDPVTERRILAGFRQVERTMLDKPPRHYFALVEKAAARLGSSLLPAF